jgi:6-phosphogluconate dehydrogenase (decarboxylating)
VFGAESVNQPCLIGPDLPSAGQRLLQAAIDEGVPVPVISAALFGRFESRGLAEYADELLSAMRYEFGGHIEKSGKQGDH